MKTFINLPTLTVKKPFERASRKTDQAGQKGFVQVKTETYNKTYFEDLEAYLDAIPQVA